MLGVEPGHVEMDALPDVGRVVMGASDQAARWVKTGCDVESPEKSLALERLLRLAAAVAAGPELFHEELDRATDEIAGDASVDVRSRIAWFVFVSSAAAAYAGAQLADELECEDFTEGLRELERMIEGGPPLPDRR